MTTCQVPETVEDREAEYWDRQASRLTDAELESQPLSSDALAEAFLAQIGDVRGRRVLDVGCGTGAWAVHMAQAGADVWGIDISPQSVAVANRRAQFNGVADHVHASVMSATAMRFEEGFFDVIYGQDIIHHLDGPAFGREVARVLKPGGHACFSENCANNFLLMLCRNHLCGKFGIPRWSSDDEYPLTRRKLREFSRPFAACDITFPKFICFFYFDAKFFKYRNRLVSWLCHTLDESVHRLAPFLRQYSYRQLIRCEKAIS